MITTSLNQFLARNGFSLRKISKDLFHMTHLAIGFTLIMTTEEVGDYASNHCYPGWKSRKRRKQVQFIPFHSPCVIENSIELKNQDFRSEPYPRNALTISDPPYNCGWRYDYYFDKMAEAEYMEMLSRIKLPAVIIHTPETTINLLPRVFGKCEETVAWVYNSNMGRQHKTISWWGCKPDFSRVTQEYKNLKDKRVRKLMSDGCTNSLYDWWQVQPVMNVSREKTAHPTQIPEEIIRRILLTTAGTDQLICDPFLGSGTTPTICARYGYRFTGSELSPNYFEIAKRRVQSEFETLVEEA